MNSLPNPFFTDKETKAEYESLKAIRNSENECGAGPDCIALAEPYDFFEETFGLSLEADLDLPPPQTPELKPSAATENFDSEESSSKVAETSKKRRRAKTEREMDAEELDSDDDGSEEGAALEQAEDYVLCSYDRINRAKDKGSWRLRLKGGVMRVGGRERVFSESDGFFKWE